MVRARAHRRSVAVATLFALLFQLALAFGHVHLAPNAPFAVAAVTTGGGKAGHSGQPDTGHKPDNDYCAICAVMTLLTGAQTAAAPALVLPADIFSTEIASVAVAARVASLQVAFRSRAPPLS
jgi:hypothetical protein